MWEILDAPVEYAYLTAAEHYDALCKGDSINALAIQLHSYL